MISLWRLRHAIASHRAHGAQPVISRFGCTGSILMSSSIIVSERNPKSPEQPYNEVIKIRIGAGVHGTAAKQKKPKSRKIKDERTIMDNNFGKLDLSFGTIKDFRSRFRRFVRFSRLFPFGCPRLGQTTIGRRSEHRQISPLMRERAHRREPNEKYVEIAS